MIATLAAVFVVSTTQSSGGDGNTRTVAPATSETASAVTALPPQLRATEAHSPFGMVATGSPEATRTAVRVLEEGGNAIDAAVTAALTLGVADSDASGIGGATYMVIRLASGHTTVIDGTAKAPGKVHAEQIRKGQREDRTYGHEMVAVPTTLAVLDLAIRKYGTIPMSAALQPAIEIAEEGYALSPIQVIWTGKYHQDIMDSSDYVAALVMKDGKTIGQAGEVYRNPDLAKTMRHIAAEGVKSFYRGDLADRISADMAANGGSLRKGDLAMLRVSERRPVRTTYRGHEVLTVPSPGGGESLIEGLNILETFPSDFLAERSIIRHQTFIEVFRIATADRAGLGAGLLPGMMPGATILSKGHARDRALLIVPGKAIPDTSLRGPIDPECLPDGESTTQVSVIDMNGNAVSLTQSLGRSFGAKVATPGLGFLYNSFLEGFKIDKPNCPGFLRPYGPCGTDMSPAIVLRDDLPLIAFGTPGSNRIPSILAGVLSNIVDGGMSLREAVEAPRVAWGGMQEINVEIELAGANTEAYVEAFNAAGYEHPVESVSFPADPQELTNLGGVNAVAFDPVSGTYTGVVDPRRGGLAMGPRAVATDE